MAVTLMPQSHSCICSNEQETASFFFYMSHICIVAVTAVLDLPINCLFQAPCC
jgi:hypothetical protein